MVKLSEIWEKQYQKYSKYLSLLSMKQKILNIKKDSHAIAYDNDTCQGVTYTLKKQNDNIEVWSKKDFFAYAQTFEDNKMKSHYPNIKNLSESQSKIDIIKWSYAISNLRDYQIRVNIKDDRSYKKITNQDIKKYKFTMNKIGGKAEIQNLRQSFNYYNFYNTSKVAGYTMLEKISITCESEKVEIHNKH